MAPAIQTPSIQKCMAPGITESSLSASRRKTVNGSGKPPSLWITDTVTSQPDLSYKIFKGRELEQRTTESLTTDTMIS